MSTSSGCHPQDPRSKYAAKVTVTSGEAKMDEGKSVESLMVPQPDYGEKSYTGSNKLCGKVAIVTGGDSGIGRAVTICYAKEGADIVLTYHLEEEYAKQTCALIESFGRKCVIIGGDIADPKHCQEVIDLAMTKFGHLDILVNNAAYQRPAVESLLELDHATVMKTFQVNIIAMFELSRLAIKHMKPGSSIINTASVQGYKPSFTILDYACTKGAIITFTQGFATEAAEKHGVRVNCVAPGPIWTPLIVKSFPKDRIESFGKETALKRPAQPVEAATPFVYLASDDASYIIGDVINVNGGMPGPN